MTTETTLRIVKLQDALAAIKTQCDGAHSRDYVGFNGYDVAKAQRLIGYRNLNEKGIEQATKLAYKYRKQLLALGINATEFLAESQSFVPAAKPAQFKKFDCVSIYSTAAAHQVKINGRTEWIPASQSALNIDADGIGTIEIAAWLCAKKGL